MVQSFPVKGENMVSTELLEILRCPNCVREKQGILVLHKDSWLVCQDCSRKYPIIDDIPVMLIDEGDKWINTAQDVLPVPPPSK
jgi:uncharacterized protein YbaR (Trm112 family)